MYKLGTLKSDGFYDSFETLTPEQAHQALMEAWTTLDQRVYNAIHTTCPTCKGRGYRRVNVERTRGRPPRWENENCGCPQCHGTGAVLK